MRYVALQEEAKRKEISQNSQLIALQARQGFDSRKQCGIFIPDNIPHGEINGTFKQWCQKWTLNHRVMTGMHMDSIMMYNTLLGHVDGQAFKLIYVDKSSFESYSHAISKLCNSYYNQSEWTKELWTRGKSLGKMNKTARGVRRVLNGLFLSEMNFSVNRLAERII